MREDHLVATLVELSEHIEVPRTRDITPAVLRGVGEPAPRSSWRRRVLAVSVAVVAVLALPGPRDAIADWFGLKSVHIVRVDNIPTDLSTRLSLGREVSLDEARRAPFTVLTAPGLGVPAHAYMGEPSSDSVSLVWAASGAAEIDDGVGVLLTEIPGSLDGESVLKRLTNDTSIEQVTVRGVRAYWLTGGRHELLYVAPDGHVRSDTTRFAANTLLWSDGAVTFRLESNLGEDDAVALAESLQAL